MKYFVFIFLFSSCGYFQIEKSTLDYIRDYKKYENSDYLESLKIVSNQFINKNLGKSIIALPKRFNDQINKLAKKIYLNNELILKKESELKVYLVKDKRVFHFSLPGGNCFFSIGLIKKYLRSEDVFLSVLASELVRLEFNLFKKEILVPTGAYEVIKMLSLSRLPSSLNNEVIKYVYQVLDRAGVDPYVQLMWVQTKNKNSFDFNLLYKDIREIGDEEQVLKTYIIRIEREIKYQPSEKNSSKYFYSLLNFVDNIRI